MKLLLMLILPAAVGTFVGGGLPALLSSDDGSVGELEAHIDQLEHEIEELRKQPPSLPVYRHWRRFARHMETYANLQITPLSEEHAAGGDFGGDQWGGIVSGPAIDVLLAARYAQEVAPVHFDRIAIDNNMAQVTFYVLGAKED